LPTSGGRSVCMARVRTTGNGVRFFVSLLCSNIYYLFGVFWTRKRTLGCTTTESSSNASLNFFHFVVIRLLYTWKFCDDGILYKYCVSGHHPSSCLYVKISSCLYFKTKRLGDWILSPSSGKPIQLGSIDRASLYFRTGDRDYCDNVIHFFLQTKYDRAVIWFYLFAVDN
jgi:hypothetical protein